MRADGLEHAIWDQVQAVLEAPDRVAEEHRRRLIEARMGTAKPKEMEQLARQIATLKRGIGRLVAQIVRETTLAPEEFRRENGMPIPGDPRHCITGR